MNVLVVVSVLLCIYLGGAVSTFSHLIVRVWLDKGRNCSQVDDLWLHEDKIIRTKFQIEENISVQEYNETFMKCGCKYTHPTCDSNTLYNVTQMTLWYKLNDTSSKLKTYNSFNLSANNISSSVASFFRCASVTPSSLDVNTCEKQFEKQTQPQSESQTQLPTQKQPYTLTQTPEPLTSDRNIGLIVGPIMAALAVLGAIPLMYYLYRRLKRNQVDNDSYNDITPIVPSDFGITDAPNSTAPAGT